MIELQGWPNFGIGSFLKTNNFYRSLKLTKQALHICEKARIFGIFKQIEPKQQEVSAGDKEKIISGVRHRRVSRRNSKKVS